MEDPSGAPPASARDRASAALLLSLALLYGALPDVPVLHAGCEFPSESVALDSLTSVVSCDPNTLAGPALRGPVRLLFGQSLDLNHASARTLEVLPGIGPKRAAAIVEARSGRPFERVSDLRRISGIGPRTIAGLAGRVQVEPLSRSADR